MTNIRVATLDDWEALMQMRYDFTVEDYEVPEGSWPAFREEFSEYYKNALESGRWQVWVADVDGEVVSHVYLELVDKVPRPGKRTKQWVYMTNVYTKPPFRGQGLGGQILQAIEKWAREQEHEFIIVWPSEGSRVFYGRHGYQLLNDPMELVTE